MPRILAALVLLLAGSPGQAATPEQIKEVARDMVCLCGNCNRESLATCICSDFAVPERQAIGRRLDQGQTKEQIVAAYIDGFGEMILAAPPARGFNVLAWVTPFVLLAGGVVLVRVVLVNWRRGSAGKAPAGSADGPTAAEASRQRLQRELDRFDEGD